MSTHKHAPDSPNNLDNVRRKDGQVAATSAMTPMVSSAPIHGYRMAGWECFDCGGKGVDASHLCDVSRSRLWSTTASSACHRSANEVGLRRARLVDPGTWLDPEPVHPQEICGYGPSAGRNPQPDLMQPEKQ